MFAAFTLIGGIYWFFDEPGSGASWWTGICGAIAVGVGIYNWVKFGRPWWDAANLNGRR